MKPAIDRHPIVRVVSKLLIPFIFVFALYVQFHGDYGPGGGFQAGVIFAAGIIVYCMVFGMGAAWRSFPRRVMECLLALGVLLYGGTGVVCMLKGGNFLEYSVLAHDAVQGRHRGILWVELGVGLAVTAAMVSIFLIMSTREPRR